MKTLILIVSTLLFTGAAQATEIISSKDWRAEKDVMTPLEKMGCIAETTTEITNSNGGTEEWILQVIKLATGNGDYSFPMIIAFPEAQPTTEYYEAAGKSDRPDTEPFSMTLMQPASGDKSIVANRLVDRNQIVNRLKADNSFTVDFLTKEGPTRSVEFKLRGSSVTIQRMLDTCI